MPFSTAEKEWFINMTTKELEYFMAAYRHGSIKDAAAELFVTPQGLSKVVIHLEEELGVRLFERTAKGLLPTRAAARLALRANVILNEIRSIRSDLELSGQEPSTLTVAATYGVIPFLSFPFVEAFYQAYPRTRLNLVELP
ncbi:MAG: LysR family transcriptional regulator, partial [Clostridia bacterium]